MSKTEQVPALEIEDPFAQVSTVCHPAARVLAVDDEPAACKLLSLILAPPAFHCSTASNGEEALAYLNREDFDAVISDLHMPGINGLELLAEVHQLHPHIAFLVVTGVDEVDVAVQAMRTGAYDYLVKPLRECAVIASLESALHKRKLELQVEEYRLHLEEMVEQRTGQLQEALKQIEHSYEDTLQALGAAIDLRDNETAGHSQRVCRYSLEIARAMGWSDKQLQSLARGAYLHDIGKLGIPDGILLKPGPLTMDERKVMQQHVQIGFDLVKGIPFLVDAAEIILMHHEQYGGGGYPQALKEEQILLGARIFAVADALDAITSERPYKKADSFRFARETIRLKAERQFDPKVVEVFLGIPEEMWPKIANHQRQTAGLPAELRESRTIRRLGLGVIP